MEEKLEQLQQRLKDLRDVLPMALDKAFVKREIDKTKKELQKLHRGML